MNVVEVKQLAIELRRVAGQVQGWGAQLDRLVATAPWEGHQAGQFKGSWWPRHRRTIAAVASDLEQFGETAQRNAAEQERASSVGGVGAVQRGSFSGVVSSMDWLIKRGDIPFGAVEAATLVGLVGRYKFPFTLHTFKEMASTPGKMEIGRHLGLAGKVFAGLGIAKGSYDVASALSDGDYWKAAQEGAELGVNLFAMNHPYVAAASVAWKVGFEIGGLLDQQFGISDSASTAISEHTILDEYGTTELTPAQAAEFSTRYDGVEGVATFIGDSGETAADKLSFWN